MRRLRVLQTEQSHRSVATGRSVLAGRPILQLQFDVPGGVLVGEAAPLPGYGRDGLERASAVLSAWTSAALVDHEARIFERFVRRGQPVPADAWDALHADRSSPSACFAVEQIVLQLLALRSGRHPATLLDEREPPPRILTSEVLSPLQEGELLRAQHFVERGVRVFKLKCGRDHKAELDFAHALLDAGVPLRLRVDANGGFRRSDVESWGRNLGAALDWIEDPNLEVSDWAATFGSDWPLAVDEPLVGRLPEDGVGSASNWPLRAVVLKPMALGGLGPCLRWAHWARQRGAAACVSHFFDGPVALWACSALAFAVQSTEWAAGLSRHAGVEGVDRASLPWLGDAALSGELLAAPLAGRPA